MEFDYLTDIDDDSLFQRLEELLARLEDMQDKDALLTTARCSRELRNADNVVKELRAELDRYEKVKDQARQDIKKSVEMREDKHIAQESDLEAIALLRMYTDLSSSRLSALQKAELNLQAALEHETLSLDDPLEELAMEDEVFFALQDEVRAYQAEYLAVYRECKRREADF